MNASSSLRAWAERLLLGATLEDKLAPPASFADDAPGPAWSSAPAAPGRPAALRLDAAPDDRLADRAGPPRDGQLADARQRGRLLHAFANHELLAIELFALGLLRFPDADPGWRAGVARTIVEEQAHLAGYLARMRELGVAFGDEPPSAFFWTSLAGARSARDLVAGLSLTFEQANLDFAAHYAALMRRVGDEATASLLDRVLADEVRHVAHGATWMARWRDPGDDDWDDWLRCLHPPLAPARARGRGSFVVEPRLAAGLSPRFVRELEVAGHSKGRLPVVHLFSATVEREQARGKPGHVPVAHVRDLALDHAALPLFVASAGDVVLLPRRPSLEWLAELARAGFTLPEVVAGDAGDLPDEDPRASLRRAVASLRGRPLGGLAPWGWSPELVAVLEPLRASLPPGAATPDPAALRPLFGKPWAAEQLALALREEAAWREVVGPDAVAGVVATTEEGARAALARVHEEFVCPGPPARPSATDGGVSSAESTRAAALEPRTHERFDGVAVIKAAFASSGQGLVRAIGGQSKSPLDPAQAGWLRRALAEHGAVVVEPWLDRVADLSVQLRIEDEGPRVLGVTRFFTDRRGQYLGHVVGAHDAGLAPDVRRLLGERRAGGPCGLDVLKAAGERVGRALWAAGLRGPAGVDALLHRGRMTRAAFEDARPSTSSSTLRLRPIVEVNARTTLGAVALGLARRLRPGRVGLWLHVSDAAARRAGHASLAALAERARAEGPPRVEGEPARLAGGALTTNDPRAARVVLGLLLVGEDLAACGALAARLGLEDVSR